MAKIDLREIFEDEYDQMKEVDESQHTHFTSYETPTSIDSRDESGRWGRKRLG